MPSYADETSLQAALTMVEAFAGAGATAFDLTLTDRHGEKVRFQRGQSLGKFRHDLAGLVADAAARRHNVIVRPHGPAVVFIQLDDLDGAALARVQPAAFLGLHTSPGNYQAWVAMRVGEADEDFTRRLRKGAGADPSASGATRVAGSLNFKDKYAPDFPTVAIAHTAPGRLATKEQLAQLRLVAPAEAAAAPPSLRVSRLRKAGVKKWPSYEMCLAGAPPNHGGTGVDTSRVDFTWCRTAYQWGWPVQDVAARLLEESAKARDNGEHYAQLTAERAAESVDRERGRQAQR